MIDIEYYHQGRKLGSTGPSVIDDAIAMQQVLRFTTAHMRHSTDIQLRDGFEGRHIYQCPICQKALMVREREKC